jgi:hypothetical protein
VGTVINDSNVSIQNLNIYMDEIKDYGASPFIGVTFRRGLSMNTFTVQMELGPPKDGDVVKSHVRITKNGVFLEDRPLDREAGVSKQFDVQAENKDVLVFRCVDEDSDGNLTPEEQATTYTVHVRDMKAPPASEIKHLGNRSNDESGTEPTGGEFPEQGGEIPPPNQVPEDGGLTPVNQIPG